MAKNSGKTLTFLTRNTNGQTITWVGRWTAHKDGLKSVKAAPLNVRYKARASEYTAAMSVVSAIL